MADLFLEEENGQFVKYAGCCGKAPSPRFPLDGPFPCRLPDGHDGPHECKRPRRVWDTVRWDEEVEVRLAENAPKVIERVLRNA